MNSQIEGLKLHRKRMEMAFPIDSQEMIHLSNIIDELNVINKELLLDRIKYSIGKREKYSKEISSLTIDLFVSHFKIPMSYVRSTSRLSEIVKYKFLIRYILHKKLGISVIIAGEVCNCDHSMITHSVKRAIKIIKKDENLQKELDELYTKIVEAIK